MSLPIETDRLRLRKHREEDLADIQGYSEDADSWLARNLDWPVTAEGVRAYWDAQREVDPAADPQWLCLVVELKAEAKAIGHVGIGVRATGELQQGTIGWLLGRKYRGQGFATEAARALLTYGFDELGLHRITTRTGKDNGRSWYLMERLGMRREAHFRESHVVDGRWRDEFAYALLADEWKAKLSTTPIK